MPIPLKRTERTDFGPVRIYACPCGSEIDATVHDVECPGCGQPYNPYGQRLRRDAPALRSPDMDREYIDD